MLIYKLIIIVNIHMGSFRGEQGGAPPTSPW